MHAEGLLLPRAQLLLAALLFSTGGAAIKGSGFDGWQVACLRSGVAAVFLLLVLPSARRGWSWRSLLVGAGYGATMVTFVLANKLTTAASAIYIQSTAPLYIALAGPLLLREPIRRRDLVFFAALAAGLLLCFLDEPAAAATAPDPLLGNWIAVASGVGWAGTMVGLRWLARGQGSGSAAALVAGNLCACLGTAVMALPLADGTGWRDWAGILYLGVFQIGTAYLLVQRGLRLVTAFEASLLLLLEPMLNPLFAWWLQGEVPGGYTLAAGGLILGATAVHTWTVRRRRPDGPAGGAGASGP
ncbi:MAG: DMT family transporter [Planctomycetes bacterium]|nr:DMT family transporter [Planctomycetota bacterium]